jgi:hypothetical protein
MLLRCRLVVREGMPSLTGMHLLFLVMLLCGPFLAQPANSRQRPPQHDPGSPSAGPSALVHAEALDAEGTSNGGPAIPPGTLLPVRLNSVISSAKSRAGQVITGRIMQDVPLSPGVRMRAGTKVIGHIVEQIPASTGAPASISFQFDKLVSSHQTTFITTNLRAIAGFMRILEAQIPPIGPGESDVYRWLTTVQVGGDVVYGAGGPVTTGENPNQIVGKQVNGGVLGPARAKQGAKCRGAIDGNDRPQALWVFSSDACGTYGLEKISIAHAGRTDPVGVIVLASDSGNFKIASGAGLLLRVNANRRD